ncbi:bromodomain adjacent to zinc finger domain protein 1A isoform X2 [Schistocerca gregaria]|uniref:bromodomain adjacent to zinc finger domain protein 1A isoform X2 n=1 Tax=Schistocerca gregaria TaxID=7010 RepID=UPI00211ED0FF|nr:bromodomain adjacent to zinc finger domain protein 1A isoform X2 [Schistocerca gregaria]XP_049864598.1 bromodomain adjacent to zinc finger domain protein 1A isoform X2 [Schistocerca gregaria]
MPYLHKEPFRRVKPPKDLRDEDEVFYCEMTNEVFRNYDDFCERIIQCNSLVWSCGLSGKPDLTFQEALNSEREARRALKEFPVELKVPVLYLASLTQRSSQKEMMEDVYSYIKDRYFVGEVVEVLFGENKWVDCHILQVRAPTEEEMQKEKPISNPDSRCFEPPAHLYQYEVERVDTCDEDVCEVHHVIANHVKRRKGLYTREKNKLFLRQYTEQNGAGAWVVSAAAVQKFGLFRVKFHSIFDGPPPAFQISRRVKKNMLSPIKNNIKKQDPFVKKEKRQENIQKYLTSHSKVEKSPKKQVPIQSADADQFSPVKKSPKKLIEPIHRSPNHQMAKKVKDKYRSVGNMRNNKLFDKHRMKRNLKYSQSRLNEERRPKLKEKTLEEKQRQLEERMKIKEKRKEDKLHFEKFVKEWNRRREDLELEDLKVMPSPIEVNCCIPHENFGDFLTVLEFFHSFGQVIATKNFFPYGVTFELLERALTEQEVAGPLSDIFQLLLSTLFDMQEEEDDEILATDTPTTAELDIDEHGDVTAGEAVKLATVAAGWSQLYQGVPLSKLTLDAVTLTEVLRLHLLSSGGRSAETSTKWRYQQRGGYTSFDDPGLCLRINHPHILRALSVTSVCELSIGDKLIILTCLINQILTYTRLRDVIDERGEKMRQAKAELRSHQLADMKKEKEAQALRIKEKKAARMKLKGLQPMDDDIVDTRTPEEKEQQKIKAEKEVARRKLEAEKKAKNLYAAAIIYQVLPLGTDRAHRRFWAFASLPGLFVEQDSSAAGSCLPYPTPYNANLAAQTDDSISYVRKLFEQERNSGSDKENVLSARISAPGSPSKKLLLEKNGPLTARRDSKSSIEDDGGRLSSQLLVCTASSTCPVHNPRQNVVWSFYCREEDIGDLIRSLNRRGIRESELRQNLIHEQPYIVENFPRCPTHKLNPSYVDVNEALAQRKPVRNVTKYDDTNLSFPPGTPIIEIFELYVRDCILELEEKIHLGGLGALKVPRQEWRTALLERKYDNIPRAGDRNKLWNDKRNDQISNTPVEKIIKHEVPDSRSTTPDSELSYKDPGRMLGNDPSLNQQESVAEHPAVKRLATAILQLAHCMDRRYLQKPLVEEANSENSSLIDRWEVSLMASSSFSQLYIHLLTLDNSIQWSKSLLNAVCRVCRRRRDAENMLLCDGCNKGYHLYCLKPKLECVPKGDWFCPACKPPTKVHVKKSRRLFSDLSDEDEPSKKEEPCDLVHDEVCNECGEDGEELIPCSTCPHVYHLDCCNPPLKYPPRGKWNCSLCKSGKELRVLRDGAMPVQPQVPIRQRRCCATAAVAKISRFARRLRSDSWDDEDSTHSEDTLPSRRSGRHSLKANPDLPLNYPVLDKLIKNMINHKEAWPFRLPVSKTEVPDYHTIIKKPMDLGLIKQNLENMVYKNDREFIKDVLLVFENCEMYNQVDAPEYKAGLRLNQYFEKQCEEFGLQVKEDEIQPRTKRPRLSF